MDTRRLLTMALLFVAIWLTMPYLEKMMGWGPKPAATVATATAPATSYVAASQPAAAEAGAVPNPITLGDAGKTSKDKLSITISPVTAGIDSVHLNVNDYAETPKRQKPLTMLQAAEGLAKPYATLGIHLTVGNSPEEVALGTDDATLARLQGEQHAAERVKTIHDDNSNVIFKTQYVWKLVHRTDTEASLLLTVPKVAAITKTFRIDSATYEVGITYDVKNLTNQPLKVAIDQMAATDMPREDAQIDDRFYHAASLMVNDKAIKPDFFNTTHTEMHKIDSGTRDIGQFDDYASGKQPGVWVAASNRFFVAITRPLPLSGAGTFTLDGGHVIPIVQQVASASVDLMQKAPKEADDIYGLRLHGAPIAVAANGTVDLPLTIFMGPKKRDLLKGSPLAPIGSLAYDYNTYDYGKVIQFSTNTCWLYSFCTFDQLALAILWLLDLLARTVAFHNYGIAIIILVIIIRAALHPLTKASQVNMAVMGKKMNTVKPQIEAMKKRYAGDKKKEQEETMRIYKENNVNPAGGLLGCMPMMLQMPIWIALWSGLRADLDLRHAVFIPGWINDLASPDALFTFSPITVPFVGWQITSFNLLPILLGIVFYFQMKIQTASQPKPSDEQQAQIQKYSQFMFLLFPLFLYTAPSGLNLYYFASTMAGLVDTYIVRKTLKKRGILPASASVLPTHEES